MPLGDRAIPLRNTRFNCLAVDIGSGNGRVVGGLFDGDKTISAEELHRFENGIEIIEGRHRWDVDKPFGEVWEGLKKASERTGLGKVPV